MESQDPLSDRLKAAQESAEFVSNNAFQLLRVNLLIIGIFLTVSSFFSGLDAGTKQEIATSNYMIAAIVLLLMSLMVGYLTYESASRLAAINLYADPALEFGKYNSTGRLVFNVRYAVLLSLLSVVAFAFGILDGIIPGGVSPFFIGQFGYVLLLFATVPIVAAHFGIRVLRGTREYFD